MIMPSCRFKRPASSCNRMCSRMLCSSMLASWESYRYGPLAERYVRTRRTEAVKFSIAVNMMRRRPDMPMETVAAQALELVTTAERLGFHIAWAAEHHTIEYTIAPNPLVLIIHWAAHTRTMRLGTAVITAPYWNPLRAAGEIALADVLTHGRLEVGFGRGAYQYEFDRMAGGMAQERGGDHLRELIPAVQQLWQGDYAHDGV